MPGRRAHLSPAAGDRGQARRRAPPTKQRPFPSPQVVLSCGSTGTVAASDAHPAGHPLPGVTGYRTPRSSSTNPQAAGPGRASPVPAATIDTFRAPYAGESLTAALPGSTPLPWPSPRSKGLGTPCSPPSRAGLITTSQASRHATDRILAPPIGPLTLGSDPARFQAKPPACYRAPWQLPGPDFHRQATTSF